MNFFVCSLDSHGGAKWKVFHKRPHETAKECLMNIFKMYRSKGFEVVRITENYDKIIYNKVTEPKIDKYLKKAFEHYKRQVSIAMRHNPQAKKMA